MGEFIEDVGVSEGLVDVGCGVEEAGEIGKDVCRDYGVWFWTVDVEQGERYGLEDGFVWVTGGVVYYIFGVID